MTSTNKKNILIIAVIIPIIFLDGYILFSANSENVSGESVIQNINTEINKDLEKSRLRSIIQATNDDRQKMAKYFVDQEGEVSFVDWLEKLADKSGVKLKIDSVNFSDYKVNPSPMPVELVDINLTVIGSWSSVVGFWTLLESSPYRLDVNRIDFEKGENLKGTSVWNLSIDITAYKKK